MLHNPNRRAVVIADEHALTQICGISMLERLLRNLQRIGVRDVQVVCENDAVARHATTSTWARAELRVEAVDQVPTEGRFLFVDAAVYHDARLLRALLQCTETTALIDSIAGTFCNAALVDGPWPGIDALRAAAERRDIAIIDVETQPRYVVDLRREIRPVWFAAQEPDAENLILDAAQNGTLDLPAMAHGPIETAIIRRLCRTRITPMQITLFTALVSLGVIVLFARGNLLAGTLLRARRWHSRRARRQAGARKSGDHELGKRSTRSITCSSSGGGRRSRTLQRYRAASACLGIVAPACRGGSG
jgi:hypothetical protein